MMRSLALVLLLSCLAPLAMAKGTIDFVLLLDESGSMEVSAPFSDRARLRVDSAKLFIELCGPSDRVGVIGFGDRITYHTGHTLQPVDGQWKSYLFQRINGVGGIQAHTDMLAALRASMEVLSGRKHKADRTFILFLTDGKIETERDVPPEYLQKMKLDEYRKMVERAAEECARQGYPILAIGLGSAVDQGLLSDLANNSGGRFYRAESATELQRIYTDIFVNLADRFSVRAGQATSPLPVKIEPNLKEFIALAFPRDPQPGRRKTFSAGFAFQPENGSRQEPTEVSGTKSWSLARLKDPSPGAWQVHFDPNIKVDVLLVKNTGCRFQVVQPGLPEYPQGPVPLEVLLTDDQGNPSDSCIGEVEAELTGPGLAQPAVTKLSRVDQGRLAARTQPLSQEGDYTLKIKSHPAGGTQFSNERTVTFKIKQQQARQLSIAISRPDQPTYLQNSSVPLEVRITATDGLPLAAGQLTLTPRLVAPPGATQPTPAFVEESPGLFKASTGPLTTTGQHKLEVSAELGGDPRTKVSADRAFEVVQPPPDKIDLVIDRPLSKAHYPSVLELKAQVTRADGSPVPGADVKVVADVSGPGVTRKVTLTPDAAGGFSGQTPLLTAPGKYQASYRAELKADPRSFATKSVSFKIVAPVLTIADVKVTGDKPFLAGEPFGVEFKVKAGGTTGNPEVKAAISPPVQPGEAPQAIDAPLQPIGPGAYRITHDKALLGATRVDLTASAPTAGNQRITTSVGVPVEAFLTWRVRDQSVAAEQPSTVDLDLLSLHADPVTAKLTVSQVTPGSGAEPSVPKMTPTSSVGLTRAETLDDFTGYPITVECPASDTSGEYKADLSLTFEGKHADGKPWSRTVPVKGAKFLVNRSPASSPFFWLVLALLVAAFFLRPHFGGCWLKVNDQRVDVGSKTGLFGTTASVGGPDQLVTVLDSECTPVILRAGWAGKFHRDDVDGTHALKSGDRFDVGGVLVKFVKGSEPKEAPKESAEGSGSEPPAAAGSVDDFA